MRKDTQSLRADLDEMITGKEVVQKLRSENVNKENIYPQALGWLEVFLFNAKRIAREALDEVDKLQMAKKSTELDKDHPELEDL